MMHLDSEKLKMEMCIRDSNDPTKLIEIVEIGKQLLMTRGTPVSYTHLKLLKNRAELTEVN